MDQNSAPVEFIREDSGFNKPYREPTNGPVQPPVGNNEQTSEPASLSGYDVANPFDIRSIAIDPASLSAAPGEQRGRGRNPIDPNTGRPRRGRPSGDGTGVGGVGGAARVTRAVETATQAVNLIKIGSMMQGLHSMAVAAFNMSELELPDVMADGINDAVKEWAKHHNVGTSEKTLSEVNLASALIVAYGSMAIAIYKRPRTGTTAVPGANVRTMPTPPKPDNKKTDTKPEPKQHTPTTPSELFAMNGVDFLNSE